MPRVKSGVQTKARHKKVLKMAKGFRGRAKNCYRIAIERVERAMQYAYRDRRNKKREFRSLWIQRINAASRLHGLTYSKLMDLMHKNSLEINKKMLSELAVHNSEEFSNIVSQLLDSSSPKTSNA